MKLELRNDEVVWLKKDGTISEKPVSTYAKIIRFFKFPEPLGPGGGKCKSIQVVYGDPLGNGIIIVRAFGNSWGGEYLLSKLTDEYEELENEETEYAKTLVENPPPRCQSLAELFEEHRHNKRTSVDVRALSQIRGLTVWESHKFDGYWTPGYDGFYDLPKGWDILPRGDALLTKRVRRNPYWIIKRKTGKYSENVGTAAIAFIIQQAFRELGGEEGAAKRRQKQLLSQEKREAVVTEKLREAILRCFTKIPKNDLSQILQISRSRGAVGTAQWLYFTTYNEAPESFDRAAYLAVRAHIRHNHTNYPTFPK